MVLGIATRIFVLEPFSFLFIWFRFRIVLVIFPSFSLKIIKKSFFSNPFGFFFSLCFRFCVGYVSFLCLENYPLSKGFLFSNPFRFCFFRFG